MSLYFGVYVYVPFMEIYVGFQVWLSELQNKKCNFENPIFLSNYSIVTTFVVNILFISGFMNSDK